MSEVRKIMDSAAMPIPGALYRGCGRCWVAVNAAGEIVGLLMMADYPVTLLADVGRRRYTAAAARAVRGEDSRRFAAHRLASRERLGRLGEVVSGMASGGMFYPKRAELRAVASALKV